MQDTTFAVEVGSRGLITKDNQNSLKTTFRTIRKKFKWKQTKNAISKLVILSSYSIFNTRAEHSWYKSPILKPIIQPN